MLSKMQLSNLLALALSLASAEAAHKGFNYGNMNPDGSAKSQANFEQEFNTAKNLVGTEGFTSARLYTMIQGGSTNSPISAIPAAIAQDTSLLLGLWTSGGNIDNELAALKAAIDQYGSDFGDLVVGISVGSEDLYRNSEIGVQADAGIGLEPDVLVNYIQQVRDVIAGTSLSGASIGHVDTWNAWTNSSNAAVIEAVDWLGFDGYPYFQNTMANSIDDAKALFDEAVDKTKSAAGNKEVWITETGWPVSGDTENLAVASVANAKQFWDEVGCPLFDSVNTWWYILQDASGSSVPSPSFGIVGNSLTTEPLFDLSCKAKSSSSAASSATSTSTSQGQSTATTTSSSSSSSSSSTTSSARGPSVTGGSGSSGSSGSGSGSGVPHGSSSIPVIPTSSITSSSRIISTSRPSASATVTGGAGSGSGSGSGSGAGSSTTSPSSPVFTGSANTVSGSILGLALFAVGAVAFA